MTFQEFVAMELQYEVSGMEAGEALNFLDKVKESGIEDGLMTRLIRTQHLRGVWEEWYDDILHTTPTLSREWIEITKEALNTKITEEATNLRSKIIEEQMDFIITLSPTLYDYLENKKAFHEKDGGVKALEKLSKDPSVPLEEQKEVEEILENISELREGVEINEVEYIPIFQRGF